MPEARSSIGARVAVGGLLLVGLGTVALAVLSATGKQHHLQQIFGAAWFGFVILAMCLVTHGAALIQVLRGKAGSARMIRNGLCVLCLSWGVTLILLQPFDQFRCELAMAIGSSVFAIGVVGAHRLPQRLRAVRGLELLFFNVCLTAVLAELALAGLAAWSPSPILMVDDASVPKRMSALARKIGRPHMGFPTNTSGHYDSEFVAKEDRQKTTIAMIGDSFSASFVPHHYHFTTVAERKLQEVEIYNFGIAGIGPHEYLHILLHQVLPLEPDAILIGVFAGNDLGNLNTNAGPSSWVWPWFDRNQVRVYTVPHRLLTLAKERQRGGARSPAANISGLLRTEEERVAAYPWLHDHTLEVANFSEQAYLELVRKRIGVGCAPSERAMEVMFECLDAMRVAAGERPLGVVLLPAEFHVEDRLWQDAVRTMDAAKLDRSEPQAAIGAGLVERGVPVLDLLPIMRAEPEFEDGDRHLYLLRDTHFNVRGNEVAAQAIAGFVRELLAKKAK